MLAPFLGFISAATMASHAPPPAIAYLAALSAMLLNAGSNGLNQIFDIEIDRINKPTRPLPAGTLTKGQAAATVIALYGVSIAIAALVNVTFLVIVIITALLTYTYSAPPLRTKRHVCLANVTIAIPRGMLLIVAGWASVSPVTTLEPWFIGLVFGLFVLGAASTKDFADIEGDAAHGCTTLPIKLGVERAAKLVMPFLSLPFLLLPVGSAAGILSANAWALLILTAILFGWGSYAGYLLIKDPESLATEKNHPSWRHMYLILIFSQLGLAVSYVV